MLDTTEKIGYTLLGLSVIAIAGLSAPSMIRQQGKEAAIAQQLEPISSENLKIAAEEQMYLANAPTAVERYRSGVCQPISKALPSTTKGDRPVEQIRRGEPIIRGAVVDEYLTAVRQKPNADNAAFKGFYLAEGTLVCDFDGKTAVTVFDPEKGYTVSGNLAFTRDPAVIEEFRKKHPNLYTRQNVTK